MKEDGFATTLIPIDKIKPPLFQCRTQTLDENLDELVESIKTVGLLEPLTIRIDKDNESELVIGSRRLKACKKVELSVVPCVVRELTDEQALEIEGCENLNRNDLSPEEKTRLVSEWAKLGYDANGIAGKVHKSYTWVTSFLPSEFKDSKKAEAGKLGGEAKSATISVAKQDLSNLTLCEGCKTSRSGVAPWHGRLALCPDCMAKADLSPEVFEYAASIKNGEAKVLAEKYVPKEMKPRDYLSYAEKEAERHPKESEMDKTLHIKAQSDPFILNGGWKVEYQKVYTATIVICKSDLSLTRGSSEIMCFWDGEDVHPDPEDDLEKRQRAQKELKQHDISAEILAVRYKRYSPKEGDRLWKETLAFIEEFEKWEEKPHIQSEEETA